MSLCHGAAYLGVNPIESSYRNAGVFFLFLKRRQARYHLNRFPYLDAGFSVLFQPLAFQTVVGQGKVSAVCQRKVNLVGHEEMNVGGQGKVSEPVSDLRLSILIRVRFLARSDLKKKINAAH